MSKTLLGLALGLLVVYSVWWVQAPPRGEVAYRESAQTTLEKLRSRAETARLWVDQLERDRVHGAAVEIALEEAETGAGSALSQFEGYEPPQGLEPLRSEVSALGSEAKSALGNLRIAAHQDRWEALPHLAAPLPALSARLDELSRKAEP